MAYIKLFQNEKWWSHSAYSYGYISMEYSHWREGTTQCYKINYSAGVSSGAYYSNGINIYVILDGVTYGIGSGIGTNNSSSWYHEGSGTYYIENKTSGHTGFYAAVYDAKTNKLLWAGGTANLNVDNAYPTVTSNPYVTSRSINSLSFNIGGVDIASDVYWSLDNANWNHAVAQDVTIYNLSANTGYTIYVQYRNTADHSLTTTATCTGTTLPQATITSPGWGFSVNSNSGLTVNCTNNSGCPVKFFLETIDSTGNGVRRYTTDSTWDASYTFSNSQILSLLQYAPNSNSLSIRVGVSTLADWVNESHWSFTDGSLKVVSSNPTFSNWTYEDVNSKTLALTGNNQIVVKGYSSIRGIITTANKATAKNYATMKKYQLSIGSQAPKENNYSSSSTVNVGDLTATSNVFLMYAIDSRTNSTLAQKTVSSSNYKEYFNIAIDTSKTYIKRQNNGIGSNATLNVEGKIWNGNFGAVTNSIKSFEVFYKLTTASEYKSITVENPTITNNTFQVNASIEGDLGADGFTVTSAFHIQIKVTDELSSSTYTMTLGSGTPSLAIHPKGVAVNKPYDTDVGGALQVNGQIVGNGGGSWGKGRDGAIIKNTSHGQTAGYSFNPLGSIKTTLGSWEFGNLSGEESLAFSYVTDTDYNAGNNKSTRVNISKPIKESWLMPATVLYNNASATRGTVTLSESPTNFTYLDIYYYGNSVCTQSVRIANTSNVALIDRFPVVNDKIVQIGVEEIRLSGSTITRNSKVWFNFYGGTSSVDGGVAESMAIYKVVGYR